MERLFSPCTRLLDILESLPFTEGIRDPLIDCSQELNLDVATEELLSAERAFTYADVYAMLGNRRLAWLTPHASVVRANGGEVWSSVLQGRCIFRLNVDGKELNAFARAPEHLLEICDVILRLLAASVVHSILLQKWNSGGDTMFINATSLAYLMEQCQSLKALTLQELDLDENHCRVFGAYSRPGLEIELVSCQLTRAGTSALAQILGRNQGPTKLILCDINYSVLANGLLGNSRLKSLHFSNRPGNDNQELLAIAGALKENKGLVDLDLRTDSTMSDETWGAICDSVKTHPTLQVLHLSARYNGAPLAPAVLKFRIQALVDMMKVSMSIHTIHVHNRYNEHELFRRSVTPYLEMNRLWPRIRAIQKTRPMAYRVKVLGRALLSARSNANSFWMLLSGNPEVAFPSMTATTTLATTIPTPATVVVTSNAAAVAATVTATRSASAAGISDLAERKTCP
jgi:hypothetical protein